MPKVTLVCHPFAMLSPRDSLRRAGSEAKPKDLANEKEILRCAQNDTFAIILGT
jgi:hypothetical protein